MSAQAIFEAAELERSGQFARAATVLSDALRSDPGNPELLRCLGRVLLQGGQYAQASQALRQAALRAPKSAEILTNRGIALAALGDSKKSALSFRKAIAANPGYVGAHYNLGMVLQNLRRHEEAIAAFEAAIALDPGLSDAHCALGVSLAALGKHDKAVECYERAIACRPRNHIAIFNLGVALQMLGRVREAIARFEDAIAMAPDYAEAHHGLGIALQMMGRPDAARAPLAKAAELAPQSGQFLRDLAENAPVVADDALSARLMGLKDTPGLGAADRVHAHAALAKILRDNRDDDGAFEHILEANRLWREHIDYDERKTLALFDSVRAAFTPELLQDKSGCGDPSRLAVFVIGMPRSGSTLVEQILATHPDAFGAGEINAFGPAMESLGLGGFDTRDFLAHAPAFSPDQLKAIGETYLASLRPFAPQASRIVDKFLNNFICAGMIHLALPNAKIVHVMRDPMDTCVSRFSKVFVQGSGYAHDLAELGRYHRAYLSMMDHWRAVLPQGVMLDLEYEALIAEPDTQIRRLIAHCGLDWNDSCLRFQDTQRVVSSPSRLDVRKPLVSTAVGRWKRHRAQLQPLMDALGPGAAIEGD